MEQFITAELPKHTDALRELNVAYMQWACDEGERLWQINAQDVLGMPVERYVEQELPKVVGNPAQRAVFYLVLEDQHAVGMGGLRCLDAQTAEIKRIYVTPGKRGSGLGERIFTRLLADAKAFEYQRVRLDTAPFMKSAHRIYEAHGFVDIGPYQGAEVPAPMHPVWRFMEKAPL